MIYYPTFQNNRNRNTCWFAYYTLLATSFVIYVPYQMLESSSIIVEVQIQTLVQDQVENKTKGQMIGYGVLRIKQ